ncbi:hypothetical protein COXBURSA331_A1077 [Coxiella burnetii RSA 331]|nr:hypothetical protein COXBURSA331_A1077 [Coxiella burnetii RSA 331]AIT63016.1 hypothetical protein CBNA_0703 [Coxiella burnetii str. Namibia]EDR36371.1 hypothetical protein COXBURSA334_0873 [Coxiella burnetii Q321]
MIYSISENNLICTKKKGYEFSVPPFHTSSSSLPEGEI